MPGLLPLHPDGRLLTPEDLPTLATRRSVTLRLLTLPPEPPRAPPAPADGGPAGSGAPPTDAPAHAEPRAPAAAAAPGPPGDPLLPHISIADLVAEGHRVRRPVLGRRAAAAARAAARPPAPADDTFIDPPVESRVRPAKKASTKATARVLGYRVFVPLPPGSPKPYAVRIFPRSAHASWRAALDAALAYEREALGALPADDPRRSKQIRQARAVRTGPQALRPSRSSQAKRERAQLPKGRPPKLSPEELRRRHAARAHVRRQRIAAAAPAARATVSKRGVGLGSIRHSLGSLPPAPRPAAA